jgi:hypothetical protein
MIQIKEPYVQSNFNNVRGQYACVKPHIDGYNQYLKEDGKWGYVQDAKIFSNPNDAVAALRGNMASQAGSVQITRPNQRKRK